MKKIEVCLDFVALYLTRSQTYFSSSFIATKKPNSLISDFTTNYISKLIFDLSIKDIFATRITIKESPSTKINNQILLNFKNII